MRMTSKGQVTVPKAVREKLGVGPGSNIGFEEDEGKILLVNRETEVAEDTADKMIRHMVEFGRKAKRISMTSEELMELTRGPFNDLDAD